MARSKFLVLWNIVLMAILVFAFQVAARELIEQSFTREADNKQLKANLMADGPWGHGYNPPSNP
ncbi:Mitogen-activated protein kinase [Actinidia chinensis var. chinensis]|uniref:Mitogen-activated protein kinase n=1 Tax=Actinidia chinensis var. chinensis TaxID=1590841 RepID=A0A2R6R8T9_ACTCC|nr:Mitogen-activated protein kinase [Actinidia chinensis var. chinensis]